MYINKELSLVVAEIIKRLVRSSAIPFLSIPIALQFIEPKFALTIAPVLLGIIHAGLTSYELNKGKMSEQSVETPDIYFAIAEIVVVVLLAALFLAAQNQEISIPVISSIAEIPVISEPIQSFGSFLLLSGPALPQLLHLEFSQIRDAEGTSLLLTALPLALATIEPLVNLISWAQMRIQGNKS